MFMGRGFKAIRPKEHFLDHHALKNYLDEYNNSNNEVKSTLLKLPSYYPRDLFNSFIYTSLMKPLPISTFLLGILLLAGISFQTKKAVGAPLPELEQINSETSTPFQETSLSFKYGNLL